MTEQSQYQPTLRVGERVAALYPNHRWGTGSIVAVNTDPGLKPYEVRSDRSGEVGHFLADGVMREVPVSEVAARRAWRSAEIARPVDADLIQSLDSVAGFLADDTDRAAEYDAVTEARRRIAAGL